MKSCGIQRKIVGVKVVEVVALADRLKQSSEG
jgi:hypothetical protein